MNVPNALSYAGEDDLVNGELYREWIRCSNYMIVENGHILNAWLLLIFNLVCVRYVIASSKIEKLVPFYVFEI